MAVEIISDRTSWEVGKEQMGEEFFPSSVDNDNTIYVADISQNMLLLLSASNGSFITSITLKHCGIVGSFAVRFHDQCLFVEHHRNSGKKYAISKF